MKSSDIREKFLQFFESKRHTRVASSSLVPHDDPTLLFTNAGMNQFKDCFLGLDKRAYTRAVSSQKCVRAGGKHNDLENVGYTARHHTFFEMLGNFSFGDYFKKDAIHYAWEFLTSPKWLNIPKDKLTITVYATDDEAFTLWNKEIGVPAERIIRIGDNKGAPYASDNFWAMGDTGPCGPCTEIFYDHGAHIWGGPPGSKEEDGDRFIEIWNNVFMQFNRTADGKLHPLPAPSVDTGMGLERISAVMQHVHANYEIDLFQNLLKAVTEVTGNSDEKNMSRRVLADHIRSCSFLIADGVIPSNERRGYVLRRIIRRAIRHGHKLGVREEFFYKLVPSLVKEMGDAYPELREMESYIQKVLLAEEKQFLLTLENGLHLLESIFNEENLYYWELKERYNIVNNGIIPISHKASFGHFAIMPSNDGSGSVCGIRITSQDGKSLNVVLKEVVYQFKDYHHLYGAIAKLICVLAGHDSGQIESLKETIRQIKENYQFDIDVACFSQADIDRHKVLKGDMAFKLHDTYGFPIDLTNDICRERGYRIEMEEYEKFIVEQQERSRAAGKFSVDYNKKTSVEGETQFTGYETLVDQARVVALLKEGESVKQLNAGEKGVVVTDKTPFYAESGGQAGDAGLLQAAGCEFVVGDTQKSGKNFLHIGDLSKGTLKIGDTLNAKVDHARRKATALNHSATHLLHAALRKVLGEHVQQKGSLVNSERLRFDFSHFESVTAAQLKQIEMLVNEQIRANTDVSTKTTGMEEAKKLGAMALFGEKYGDSVRVLAMGENNFSVELCGGTHVKRTGDIGLFRIVSEAGIASGVRRIEAVTGAVALAVFDETEQQIEVIAQTLKTNRNSVLDKVNQLQQQQKQLEKELQQLKTKLAASSSDDLLALAQDINGVHVLVTQVEGVDGNTLRDLMDQFRNKLGTAVVLLAAIDGDKVVLVAGVTQNTTGKVKAGDLMKEVAPLVGGKGGGRPDMAQGGGTEVAGLDQALAHARDWLKAKL